MPDLGEGIAIRYPGTGPDHDPARPHICVIVSPPTPDGELIIVPVETHHPKCDGSCVIDPKEWRDCLTRLSFIAYYNAKIVSLSNTQSRVNEGEITYIGPVPKELFSRIKYGMDDTNELEEFVKNKYKPGAPKGRVLRARQS